ncbi:hypothetical protein FOZ63_029956, partial [Perkinsus olseni]
MLGFLRRVGPRLMQVNSLRPYGQPITAKLPYEPWPYDHRYIGMTAREVITKFKLTTFPLKNFPEALLDAKVDEIYQKSTKMRFKSCINAMQLLQKGKYDKVRTIRSEDYYKPPKRPRFFQRLNRMRRSTKLGIKRNGLKRISGLTGKTRDVSIFSLEVHFGSSSNDRGGWHPPPLCSSSHVSDAFAACCQFNGPLDVLVRRIDFSRHDGSWLDSAMLVATLSLLACLSAASPTTVRVNIVVTTQVPSVEVFVRALNSYTPDDGPPWEWLGKVQQQRFSSYSLPSTSTLRIQSLWDNSNEGSSNTTKVEYHPKHRDVDLLSTQGKDTLNLAIGKHDLIDNDNGEVLEWWPLNSTATTVLGNTDHSDQLFRARFEVEELGEKVRAWREGCEDDEFIRARPDRNFVMAKLILKESMWSEAQQEIVDRALQDSRIAHTKYPRFTNNGYKRSKVSFALRKDITAWYASSRQAARPEEMPLVSGGVAAAESDTWMLTLPDGLHARVRRECMASLYKWIRRTHVLEFTALYGVRIYRE